ncbi:MAG: ACT domain-containing protein, partial [Hyphomonadaceae bacterium]|nr:ACT domain-containing protein [Hyphomonadaceae bacterium]
LRPQLGEVNMVSAPAVARERGVTLAESRQDSASTYDSVLRLVLRSGTAELTVAGTLFSSEPRVIEAEGLLLEAPIAPHMLYLRNQDRPGFIGALGKVLGDAGANIATFNLGRSGGGGGMAAALVGLDAPVSPAILQQVQALPLVVFAKSLAF